jgi:hypothetical protein
MMDQYDEISYLAMKNLHLIPTDKPSRLHLIEDKLEITNEHKNSVCDTEVNIYITSDKEIKEDWCFGMDGIFQYKGKVNLPDVELPKKIILTTDQDLIEDGVQAISDEFLKWFVKNPSCEEVEVITEDVEQSRPLYPNGNHKGERIWMKQYKIILPQEEAKKRAANYMALKGALDVKEETLEEFINSQPYYGSCTTEYLEGIEEGAKWQSERMYSEEEVIDLLIKMNSWPTTFKGIEDVTEWFEQFKKH